MEGSKKCLSLGLSPRPIQGPGAQAGQCLLLHSQAGSAQLPTSWRRKGAAPSTCPSLSTTPQVPAARVRFVCPPQAPSARSLAVPGQLLVAAWCEGSVSNHQPPFLLREDSAPPSTVLCRMEVLPTGEQNLPALQWWGSGPARARKPHTSLAAIIVWESRGQGLGRSERE